jgi:hypothetical protein
MSFFTGFRVALFVFTVLCILSGCLLLAQNVPPVQHCAVNNIRGGAVAGTFCGGTSNAPNCSSGALYNCKLSPQGNNCTLVQACAVGCLAAESPTGKRTTSCFAGVPPLTVTPTNPLGGDDLSVTAQLTSAHPRGAILNMKVDRGDLVPGIFCASPNLPAGQNSEIFGLSTGVVGAPTPVKFSADFNWLDPSGGGFELASVSQLVTLGPGGHEPPPPAIESITMTPSSISPSGISFMDVKLARMAPASGVQINVTSSDPDTAAILANGQPFVQGSCLNNNLTETIQAASSIPTSKTITLSASSGAPGQAALSTPLTVVAGCVPHGCTGGPTCGPQSDGCGGIIQNCGCFNVPGQICGAGGPNVCGGPPAFAVSGLTLSPSTIVAGRTSTATVTANQPAPMGGAIVGLNSSNSLVTVPATVTIPSGGTFANFTVSAGSLLSGTAESTITATDAATVSAVLTVTPTTVCSPQTCAQQGKSCGAISDGCGGTIACGACGGTQTCGGSGVANVCGGAAGTATLTVNATGGGGDITTSPVSGIKASPGHPASGVFDLGTTITLKTSDGHGAVWSGACSSAGAATQSCTFTFNAAGTVTANNK